MRSFTSARRNFPEQLQWIDREPAVAYLEVQVRSSGSTAMAHRGDDLVRSYLLLRLYVQLFVVGVDCYEAIVVLDDDDEAIGPLSPGEEDRPCGGRAHRRANRCGKVDTIVLHAPLLSKPAVQNAPKRPGKYARTETRFLMEGDGSTTGRRWRSLGEVSRCCASDGFGGDRCFGFGRGGDLRE